VHALQAVVSLPYIETNVEMLVCLLRKLWMDAADIGKLRAQQRVPYLDDVAVYMPLMTMIIDQICCGLTQDDDLDAKGLAQVCNLIGTGNFGSLGNLLESVHLRAMCRLS